MRELEVGYLAKHAPIMDAMRHAERDSRRRGRSCQDGLVRREPSDTDGRSVVVRITARGAHQFWRLLARLRGIESEYAADARRTRAPSVAAALRRLTPPPPRLSPPLAPRRHRPRPRGGSGP